MDLIVTVLVAAAIGFIVWLILRYVPMEPPFKIVISVFSAIVMALWLIGRFRGLVPNVMP